MYDGNYAHMHQNLLFGILANIKCLHKIALLLYFPEKYTRNTKKNVIHIMCEWLER